MTLRMSGAADVDVLILRTSPLLPLPSVSMTSRSGVALPLCVDCTGDVFCVRELWTLRAQTSEDQRPSSFAKSQPSFATSCAERFFVF